MRYPKPRFQQAYVLHGILSRRFKQHCFARYPKPTSQTYVVLHGVISHGFKQQTLRLRCLLSLGQKQLYVYCVF